MTARDLPYLSGYPKTLRDEASGLLARGELGPLLAARYSGTPTITNDRALYEYVQDLKSEYLRRAPPLSKVCFDDKISLNGTLGLHSYVSRVQGSRTKAKNELRVASLFKTTPPEFLRMVVVHEIAHLKEKDHDKAFYQLCVHMEPDYHRYELDLRLYLTAREANERVSSGRES